MNTLKKWLPLGFLVFSVLVCILLFISELVNDRFWLNDFKVYYLSAKAMLAHQQVYGVPEGLGSGFYKYSPFVLLIFIPFTFLPYKIACIIYYFVIVVAILNVFFLIRQFILKYFFTEPVKYQGWILTIVFVFALNLLYRELHLGNTNIILLLLILYTIRLVLNSNYLAAGILFSLILLFKPFFLILAIPLLLHKKFKIAFGATIFIIAQALLLIIIFGWQQFTNLHSEWMKTVFGHSASFPSGNNIEYLIRQFIWQGFPAGTSYIILFSVILLFTVLFVCKNYLDKRYKPDKNRNPNFIVECFLLIAILPGILNTDTEHFLYSLPLIAMISFTVFEKKKAVLFVCLLLLFLLYGTNSNDIVGKTIGDFYDRVGAVGISNLFLVAWGIVIYWKLGKTRSTGLQERE
jgi:hypothetical protein